MAQVFISYSRKDLSFVEQLVADVKKAGFDVWHDVSSLGGGDRWRVEIEAAIRNSQFVIVVLSPDSMASEWVEREFLFASRLKRKIIPIMYRSCELPLNYLDVNYIDVQDEKYQQNFDELLKALSADNTATSVKKKPLKYASQERVLEAAIEKQVKVGLSASLFVWIKRLGSKSIISVVGSIDEDVVLDEDNVKSKGLEIEFPIENGRVVPIGISLKLVAHEFTPSMQYKKIIVPPEGDSEVCTFIVTPNKAGRLLLNLEVLKDQVSIATRTLHTTATQSEKKRHGSMVLASIPITILVQSKSDGLSIGGNISGSVVVSGSGNVINVGEKKNSSDSSIEKSNQSKIKTPNKSVKKPSPKLKTEYFIAIIGGVATIIAALLGSPLIEKMFVPAPTSTATMTATHVLTSTFTSTPISATPEPSLTPTGFFTPISTPVPATDTPVPTVTPVPPVAIGKDWIAGCISSLWKTYPSNIPTVDKGNGCWKEPVHNFSAENGDLDFLAERGSGPAEVYGLFAPLPEKGTVTFTIRLRELKNVDLLMGIFAQPDVNSQGLLMIMLNGRVDENVFIQKDPFTYVTIQGTQKLKQENGYSITFRFDNLSARSIVNPAVFFTDPLSIPSEQKWLFLGYKGLRGSYRIDGTFLNFELK